MKSKLDEIRELHIPRTVPYRQGKESFTECACCHQIWETLGGEAGCDTVYVLGLLDIALHRLRHFDLEAVGDLLE